MESHVAMNSKFHLSAKAWVAIGFVAVLYSCAVIASHDFLNGLLATALCLSIAGIAAFDSTHIHLRRYKTWISYGPVGVFLACSLFPFIGVIWYFIVRVRIARGTMPLKDNLEKKLVPPNRND